MSSCKITVHDQNLKLIGCFSCDASKTILENLLDRNISIDHSCGGMGTCGTCRIEILSSMPEMPSLNELEQEMATDRKWNSSERLACQILPTVDRLTIKIKGHS